jgi:hypothetical protein
MATPNVFDKFWAVRAAQGSGGAFNQKDLPVAASTTINAGDLVKFSSGQLVQAIALPGSDNSATASGGNLGVVGVAMASIVTGAGGSESITGRSSIPVAIFDSNLELAMRIYNATAADAEPRDLTLGTKYQFQRWRGSSASVWWYSLIVTTTNGELLYVDRYAGSAADDDYGIVWVRAALSDTVRLG